MKRVEFYLKDKKLYLKLYKDGYLPEICKWGNDYNYYIMDDSSNTYEILDYLYNSKNIISKNIATYIKALHIHDFIKFIEIIKDDIKNGSNTSNMYYVVKYYEPKPIECSIKFTIGSVTTNISIVMETNNETAISEVTFIPHPEHEGLYSNAHMTIEDDFKNKDNVTKLINTLIHDKTYIYPNSLFKDNLRQFIIDEFNKIKAKNLDAGTEVIRYFCDDIENYNGDDE